MMTDEVDDTTINKKPGFFFKGLMSKGRNTDEEDEYFEEENSDGVDDKTIKIVGFNKAEDEYLEILEGTQSMPELDVFKRITKSYK